MEFDNTVLRVASITGGEGLFNPTPTANIDNIAGTVRITFAIGNFLGPTGTLEIANLHFTAEPTPGATTLDLTIRNLASAFPKEIPGVAVDGLVVVQ